MPRYIIERVVGNVSREELEAAIPESNDILDELGIIWIRSYVSEATGKIYCEYEAPNEELIQEHARRSGFPADQISEVAREISPAMFR